ncbi:MAG: Crp/Fnr family transcriptional regulator [Rhodospirillaceae bacterium]|nr:Crp/Fnr family transcriptional regulator [Rhodospirillaceae bacterium]
MDQSRFEGTTELAQACRVCLCRDTALFRDLSDEELTRFGQLQIIDVGFSPGDILYRQGDPGQAVFMIRDGLVKLEQFLPDGSQRIVRLVRGGTAIALEALLGTDCEHQAVALRPTSVCRLSCEVLQRIEGETPRLHRQLMAFWHASVAEADKWLTLLSTGSARVRVARLLLLLSDGEASFEMLSREDIGAMLGTTTETASRIIAEFRRDDVLRVVGVRRFTVNRTALMLISGPVV